jgi:guanylate kinase
VVSVFILPPSMPELERRLRGRASETEETLSRRYAVAEREIEHYALFKYVIVNDDVQRAFDELRSITVAERARRQRRAPLAEALLRAGRLS